MRTLLRHKKTRLFFQEPGKWTQSASRAQDFHSVDHAIDFIATLDTREVELAFDFDQLTAVTRPAVSRHGLRAH